MARGLKVLSALDSAKTQYYHYKAIVIAGMGLFTDAYDLFSISLITRIIGRIYYTEEGHTEIHDVNPIVVSALVIVALLGTAIGQLLFGVLGDLKGRRRVYGISLLLMIISSLASGFSICTTKRVCVLLSVGFFRFFLGLGIGGDYPLSSTIMSEFANKRTRGSFIAAVFSMQGFGILTSAIVTMVVCTIFHDNSKPSSPHDTPPEADIAWRLILMIGAIPAIMTFYWRMMMPETARYTALVEHNVLQAANDMEKVMDVPISQIVEENPPSQALHTYPLLSKEFLRRHGRDLFACSSTWFLVDIVFYSQVLFQSEIYKHVILKDKEEMNVYEEAINRARVQAVIAVCSTIPGYFFSVYFIDRVGRVKIQIMGFFFMALAFFAMGFPYYLYWTSEENKRHNGFMVLYGIAFFFANFGPNTTTFIVPAELFPAKFRSTCHGVSGAFGKVGAIIGSIGFSWASHKNKEEGYPKGIGMETSLIILGGVCLVGMFVTYFFTKETMGRSLEENEIYHDQVDGCDDL